jgi:aminopeptidase-like protein
MEVHVEFLDLTTDIDLAGAGSSMHALMERLYPIPRSITGPGIRETFRILGETLPLAVHRVASGTPVFDWTVPREWTLREAFIENSRGERIVDIKNSSLHVVSYSIPVDRRMRLEELRPYLHSIPEHPDRIPYRASYYRETWGFCLPHRVLESLPDGDYRVRIDASLQDGHVDYAETVVGSGDAGDVLISTHACHPAMCNDNLSGVVVAHALARALSSRHLRHRYVFLFIPTIIGSIAWLARNETRAAGIRHGLVLACLGDPGTFTYKRSRRGDAIIDRAAAHVLAESGGSVRDFVPYGYDERNYCSPGFDLPVGALSRTPHGEFPEYHSSADNLDFVRAPQLAGSLETCLRIIEIIENDRVLVNQNPKCEPQLGKRGLYNITGGLKPDQRDQFAMFWVLNFSDGAHSLLAIAERSGIPFRTVARAAERLAAAGLLAPGKPS